MKYPVISYNEYLQIDKLIGTQNLRSEQFGNKVHDEHLFIVVHQVYELWFKQILFELDSVLKIFSEEKICDSDFCIVVQRTERIVKIIRHILGQIEILESMTPMDFLDFREYLYPASGFQSLQWRQLEIKLGLIDKSRVHYQNAGFEKALSESEQQQVASLKQNQSLFNLLEKWLERTPFLTTQNFVFWQEYKLAVEKLFDEEELVIKSNPLLTESQKIKNLETVNSSRHTFHSLFDEQNFKKLQETGYFRLSQKALFAVLMVLMYRQEPIMQMPFRLLQSLIDVDDGLTQWRQKHALMVHRMLGKKIGTGGSSGHDYLKSAAEGHKVFSDLFNINTFILPRSYTPQLPEDLKKQMSFSFKV
jgi:tryptophan 2,3-dioxygenase